MAAARASTRLAWWSQSTLQHPLLPGSRPNRSANAPLRRGNLSMCCAVKDCDSNEFLYIGTAFQKGESLNMLKITRIRAVATSLLLLVLLFGFAASAQTALEAQPDITKVPVAAQPSDHFDVDAATDAYLALMPASAQARSDAYFEGGYWLILWDFLIGAFIALLLLNLGWSASMRNVAERITRWKWLQTFIYWVEYLLLTTVLGFPMAVYEGYFREWKYGLATQTFGPWMWDQTKALGLNVLLGGLFVVVLFWVVRKLPRTWWLWGSVASIVLMVFTVMIVPIFTVPTFNKVTRLDDPKVTTPILAMARANGIPAHDVWTMDASKQTTLHERQRERVRPDYAHHAERQPAAARFAGGDRGCDGTRDGALRAQSH